MLLFYYRAVDGFGKAVNGSLAARDFFEVKKRIQEDGLTAVKIVQGSNINEKLRKISVRKVSIKAVALFCRQLHIILRSGVNILNGLDILRSQTKNKAMKFVLNKVFAEVQRGRSLSEAMNDVENMLPPLLVNMVSVGEVSGNLDDILERMSSYYEKESFMKEKLQGVMVYPVVLTLLGVGMMIFFLNFVLPEITGLIIESGGQLPALTQGIIGINDFFGNYYLVLFGTLLGAYLLVRTVVPKDKYRRGKDSFLNRLPVISTSVRNVVTARFMRTVSMMLKGGIPLLYVLEAVEKIMNNAVAEKGISTAIEGVKRGERLGDHIASCGFFDPIVIHMINIGEETGELDNILDSMADYYDKEAETWLMKVMAMVEPAMIIVVGIFIAILVVSIMIPMFSMISQINNG